MADYYSILDKTISGLPKNTPEVRSAVYNKARTAIETQLRNMSPAPSEEAIASQLQLLEEAIVLIDSEYGAAGVSDELPTAPPPPPPTAELPPEPEPEPEPVPRPQTEPVTTLEAEPELEAQLHASQESPVLPVSDTVDTGAVSEFASQTQEAPIESAKVASGDLPQEVVERAEAVAETIKAPLEPVSEPPVSGQFADPGSIAVEPGTRDILDPIVSADEASVSANDKPLAGSIPAEKKSSGFLGGLVKLLVIFGLLGGGGYAVWKNKDELGDFAGSLFDSQQVEETTTEQEPETTEPELPPEPAQETAETEPAQVEPDPSTPQVAEPEANETLTTEPEAAQPEATEPEVSEPETAEPEVTQPDPQVAEPEQPAQETETTQQSGVIPIGEVAYLYEEGTAGSGATRTSAAVTWELRQESLGEGSPAEPVIIGKMDVPEKSVSIDIKIKRNIDEAVSASHLIEMRFNLPDNFAGRSVESIARFVMKATEEAPGEPLVAVPVKVTEGNFLIALDNLQQAVSVNTQLLKEASWIDVPVVYGTGKRALVTLEKGGTGERVFNQAFDDWQNR